MESGNNKKKASASRMREMMRIGIATEFGWFELKRKLIAALNVVGYELVDIGAYELVTGDDYPDFVVPLIIADRQGESMQKATWRSGFEACAEVNKIPGVCASIITVPSGLSKVVEDNDLYVRCLGGQVKGYALSRKKVMTFLSVDSPTSILSNQRLAKVRVLRRDYKISEMESHFA